jgi:TcpE family
VDLPVYTSLLRMERRLYQVGGLELPRPVSLLEAGVFSAALLALVIAARLLHLGLSAAWSWVYLVLPWVAAWRVSLPLADRKRAHLWALSQLRYLFAEPRMLARLRPVREPTELRLRVRVWQPRPPRRRRGPSAQAQRHALEALRDFRFDVVSVNGQARRTGGGR